MSGRPKNPVLPTAVARMIAPVRLGSVPAMRVAAHDNASSAKWMTNAATGTSSNAGCRSRAR